MTATTTIAGETITLVGPVTGIVSAPPPPPPPPPGGLVQALNLAGNASSTGWGDAGGYTIRVVVGPALLQGVTQAALRLRAWLAAAPSQDFACNKLFVGHQKAGGAAWDIAEASPVALPFDGAAARLVAAGTRAGSDLASFAWDRTRALVFSMHCNTAGKGGLRTQEPLAGAACYYKQNVDLAAAAVPGVAFATQAASGLYGILGIDIEEAAP